MSIEYLSSVIVAILDASASVPLVVLSLAYLLTCNCDFVLGMLSVSGLTPLWQLLGVYISLYTCTVHGLFNLAGFGSLLTLRVVKHVLPSLFARCCSSRKF